MTKPFDCAAFTDAIRDSLALILPGVDLAEEPDTDLAALTFVHPVHEATVVLLTEAANTTTSVPTLLLAVVIGDWLDLAQKDGGAQMFSLNTRLMTCAVGLMPLNNDEIAVVLCRRMPAEAIPPDQVLGLVDDMVWDYAACAGWLDSSAAQPQAPAVVEPARPRLIGSLDEL